jgi:hypothetical protein
MKRLRARFAVTLAVLGLAGSGCGAGAPEEPEGALLSARRPDLERLLASLARLEGTPLGRRAAALAEALPACDELEAHAPAGGGLEVLFSGLRCADPVGPLASLHRERGGRALAFVWPLEAGPKLRGRLELDAAGNAELALTLPDDAARGLTGLVLPGEAPPGPGVLSSRDALVHARLRPAGGLDLASLVPAGGQADRLFRLRSALFEGLVLDGTWELAIYLPESGRAVPPAALALGVRARDAAAAAMESFLGELAATWPIRRSEFSVGASAGACLLDLRILPDFAPCYVATPRALVVGYDPDSLRLALASGEPALAAEGGLVVELARLAEADARLAGEAKAAAPAAAPAWRRLRAQGREAEGQVEVRVHLDAGAGA